MTQPHGPRDVPTEDIHAAQRHDGEGRVEFGDARGSALDWPATEHREVPWHTNPDQHGADGRRPNYQDRMLTSVVVEVPPRIAGVPVELSPDLAERCRDVEGEIVRLDAQYGADLPRS